MNGLAIGVAALLPAILGPLPEAERTIVASLCSPSGTQQVTIRVPQKRAPLIPPCHAKACHGSSRRWKFDLAQ